MLESASLRATPHRSTWLDENPGMPRFSGGLESDQPLRKGGCEAGWSTDTDNVSEILRNSSGSFRNENGSVEARISSLRALPGLLIPLMLRCALAPQLSIVRFGTDDVV